GWLWPSLDPMHLHDQFRSLEARDHGRERCHEEMPAEHQIDPLEHRRSLYRECIGEPPRPHPRLFDDSTWHFGWIGHMTRQNRDRRKTLRFREPTQEIAVVLRDAAASAKGVRYEAENMQDSPRRTGAEQSNGTELSR